MDSVENEIKTMMEKLKELEIKLHDTCPQGYLDPPTRDRSRTLKNLITKRTSTREHYPRRNH